METVLEVLAVILIMACWALGILWDVLKIILPFLFLGVVLWTTI